MDRDKLLQLCKKGYVSKSEFMSRIPLGVDSDSLWNEVLQERKTRAVTLPITNHCGENYWYVITDQMIAASEVIVEELAEYEKGDISTLTTLEEVFFTSYMEGSQITMKEAMKFLQSDSEPQDVEELIIANTRHAGTFAAKNIYSPVTESFISHIAYLLTDGMDNGGGDLRSCDMVEIPSMMNEEYALPRARDLPQKFKELEQLLSNQNIHPLIKSAALQAWILVTRPYYDGNERLARLLSEIVLVRAGYGFFTEVSISAIIARNSYDYFNAIADILRDSSGGDLTYFMNQYLTMLSKAVEELRKRRQSKNDDVIEAEQEMALSSLNHDTGQDENKKILIQSYSDRLSEFLSSQSDERVKMTRLLIKYLKIGKYDFSIQDIINDCNIKKSNAKNLIFILRKENIIFCTREISNGYGEYHFIGLSTISIPYSEDLISFLKEMQTNINSTRDKRIGRIFLRHLKDGFVTYQDYVDEGQESKWQKDMGLVKQIGIVEMIDNETCKINTQLDSEYKYISSVAKEMLTKLYSSVGDGEFSVSVVSSVLEYSENHSYAFLHKFSLMRIVEKLENDDGISYRFKVTPEDKPECFNAA